MLQKPLDQLFKQLRASRTSMHSSATTNVEHQVFVMEDEATGCLAGTATLNSARLKIP